MIILVIIILLFSNSEQQRIWAGLQEERYEAKIIMYCSVANTKANQYFFRSQSLNEFYFLKIHSQGTFLHIIMMGPFSLLKGFFFQLQFPEMCFAFTLKTLLRTMPGPESKEINFVRRKKKRGGKRDTST